MSRVFNGVDELRAAKGQQVGVSDWLTITQERIDQFADATEDHQWIHVDPERAKDGPFGTTIAHGFLSLSLLVPMVWSAYTVEGVRMGVNYGLNKVRFTSPVTVGSRVRGNIELLDVSDVDGGVQVTTKVTVEIEGSPRPALIAEWITRQYV
jgi:acyl dehydratase